MPITEEQLGWWEHLAEPIPTLIKEVRALNERAQVTRDVLGFIALCALTGVQTAWGPLDELRQRIFWDIKNAASHGELPNWYDPNKPEWKG